MKVKKNSKLLKEYSELIFSDYKYVKNPLSTIIENTYKDLSNYLSAELLKRYSVKDIDKFVEIYNYINQLKKDANEALNMGELWK